MFQLKGRIVEKQDRPPASAGRERLETGSNRSQLVGKYAHHIQNHLTVILGSCDLALAPGGDAATIADQLAHIQASARAISALTKAIEPLQN